MSASPPATLDGHRAGGTTESAAMVSNMSVAMKHGLGRRSRSSSSWGSGTGNGGSFSSMASPRP